MQPRVESLGRGYRPWLIGTLVLLLGSLLLLVSGVVATFVYFGGADTPLWVTILFGLAIFGILLSLAGFVLLFAVAAWRSLREERRLRLAPPPEPLPEPGRAE